MKSKSLHENRFFEGAEDFYCRWGHVLVLEEIRYQKKLNNLEKGSGTFACIKRFVLLGSLKKLSAASAGRAELLEAMMFSVDEIHYHCKDYNWKNSCNLLEKFCNEMEAGKVFFHSDHESFAAYEIFHGKAKDFHDYLKEKLNSCKIVKEIA